MLARLLRPISRYFCTDQIIDPLMPLRTKLFEGQYLQDHEYSRLIEDLLKKKQCLSAYNMLIHSYLSNVLIDKQIYNRIQSGIGELQPTYKDVLSKMYTKYFNTPVLAKTTEIKNQNSPNSSNTIKIEDALKEATLNRLAIPKKLIKDGELLIGDIFSKVDLQKVSFKNVTINFDYSWVTDFPQFESGSELASKQPQQLQLEDDDVAQSEEQQQSETQEITLEDILRSIKSIEIGEVEFSTNKQR